MQHSTILGELEPSEHFPLLLSDALSSFENLEGGVGVAGENDVIKLERLSHLSCEVHLSVLLGASRVNSHAVVIRAGGKGVDDSIDVGVGSVLDSEPGGSIQNLQEMMVVHEADESKGGEVESGRVGRSRPDGGGHGL